MQKDVWGKYIDDTISEEDENEFMEYELKKLREKKEKQEHKDN